MTKLLHIVASPRKQDSKSNEIARAHIASLCERNPGLTVDTLDLWQEPLPEFDGDSAAAKMSFFGVGTLDGVKRTKWDEIVAIAQHFLSADLYVFGVPMWNGGIPYRLKLYIDILTQPGLLFGFDPATGYSGLVKNKKATLVCTSGVYAPNVPPNFGADFQSNYLDWWLRMIGVNDIQIIRFQPTLLTADPAAGLRAAIDAARRNPLLEEVARG